MLATLLRLSADWEAEGSCHGYRRNEKGDIAGSRILLAEEDGAVIGYLFGRLSYVAEDSSVMAKGTPCFEVEELYVLPERRSEGVGGALFRHMEKVAALEASYILLSTATKNWRAILRFYIEELGMDFWSARLFKKLP